MIWLVLLLAANLAAQKPPAESAASPPQTAQAKRGYAIFFENGVATGCGNCHVMGSRGTAVGPDLKRWARMAPRATVVAIRSSRTEYAVAVNLKKGTTFPAMKVGQEPKPTEFYDLSKIPPVLVKFSPADIESVADNTTWRHPPGTVDLTSDHLADVIAYIRWAVYGDTKGVKAEDVE